MNNFRTALTKVYAGEGSLVTTYAITQNTNAPVMINEVQWKILYKIMFYNSDDLLTTQQEGGILYSTKNTDAYYDVMHLITCFQLADSTLRSPSMDINTKDKK